MFFDDIWETEHADVRTGRGVLPAGAGGRDDDPEALRRLKQLEAIDRMRERLTLAEALSALELGRSTYYARKRRLREEGVKGLVPRSSRLKSPHNAAATPPPASRLADVEVAEKRLRPRVLNDAVRGCLVWLWGWFLVAPVIDARDVPWRVFAPTVDTLPIESGRN